MRKIMNEKRDYFGADAGILKEKNYGCLIWTVQFMKKTDCLTELWIYWRE